MSDMKRSIATLTGGFYLGSEAEDHAAEAARAPVQSLITREELPTEAELSDLVDLLDETVYGFARPCNAVVPANAVDVERVRADVLRMLHRLLATVKQGVEDGERLEGRVRFLTDLASAADMDTVAFWATPAGRATLGAGAGAVTDAARALDRFLLRGGWNTEDENWKAELERHRNAMSGAVFLASVRTPTGAVTPTDEDVQIVARWLIAWEDEWEVSPPGAKDRAVEAARRILDRSPAGRSPSPECGCADHQTAKECVGGCRCACNADFVCVERWECRVGCGLLLKRDEIDRHDCSAALRADARATPGAGDAVTDVKAIGFAVHLALYESLRLLETPDSPMGPAADAARRALRRALVATQPNGDYDRMIPEADVERRMFALWKEQEANYIRLAELSWLNPVAASVRTPAVSEEDGRDVLRAAGIQCSELPEGTTWGGTRLMEGECVAVLRTDVVRLVRERDEARLSDSSARDALASRRETAGPAIANALTANSPDELRASPEERQAFAADLVRDGLTEQEASTVASAPSSEGGTFVCGGCGATTARVIGPCSFCGQAYTGVVSDDALLTGSEDKVDNG